MSFEVGDNSAEIEKEFIESINLVLSGSSFSNTGNQLENDSEPEKVNDQATYSLSEKSSKRLQNSKQNENLPQPNEFECDQNQPSSGSVKITEAAEKSSLNISNSKFQQDSKSTHSKYGTLGNVFKKSSLKSFRKGEDLSLRNTKSLPRDTLRLGRTDSFKSILDECHSSATNILKKSQSLLKNTQSLFRTLNHGRIFNTEEKPFTANSESNVSNSERKLPFLTKDDFMKTKNLLKVKLQKTFRSREDSLKSESESSIEKNTRSLESSSGMTRSELFDSSRKSLLKNSLIYKSQFVKSQVNVQDDAFESPQPHGSSHSEQTFSQNSVSPAALTLIQMTFKKDGNNLD